LGRTHHALDVECRKRDDQEASQTAGIVDGQSVKSAENPRLASTPIEGRRQKSKARKCIFSSIRWGLLLHAMIYPADGQDRDAGIPLMSTSLGMYPSLESALLTVAKVDNGLANVLPGLEKEIVGHPDRGKSSKVLPRRWVVERMIVWLNRCRRLAKDWEEAEPQGLGRRLAARIHSPHASKAL